MQTETTPRRRGRPPAPAAADNIVTAATGLFLEAGYAATTMQDIARRFGGSKQTIYARFPDKSALFKAVILSFTEQKLRGWRELAKVRGGAEDSLRSVARALVTATLDRETTLMQRLIIAEVGREPALAEFVHSHSTVPALNLVRGIMERLISEGGLAGDPKDLAVFFCDLVIATPLRDALFGTARRDDLEQMLGRQEKAIAFFLQAARVPTAMPVRRGGSPTS